MGVAASVAGHEARHRVRRQLERSADALGAHRLSTTMRQAEALVSGLSDLKGAVMKAGQLLSIDASDLLPPEAVERLGRLQAHAEPVPFESLRAVLDEDLGPEWPTVLTDLDPRAAAAASIGQVHRARYEGRAVAVKIQYPGVAQSIDSDLAMLHRISGSWLALTGRKIDLEQVFEEMRSVLHQEADYVQERSHMERFGAALAGRPEYVVPAPVPAVSGARVLTASWQDGLPLAELLGPTAPRELARWLATALLDLYCLEFFELGLVQTDPNPGNFLVRPDRRQLVLLDFGATLVYEDSFRRRYLALLEVIGRGRRADVVAAGVEQGMLDPRESAQTRDLFAELLVSAVEPFLAHRQPFDFSDADYAGRTRDVGQAFIKALRYSPPPRELVFLHRKLGGLFNIIKRMGVRLDLAPYWTRMVGTELRPAA